MSNFITLGDRDPINLDHIVSISQEGKTVIFSSPLHYQHSGFENSRLEPTEYVWSFNDSAEAKSVLERIKGKMKADGNLSEI
jgi:hypothetical protein